MRTTAGPERLSVSRVVEPLPVYRVVRTENPDDPVLVTCLMSNYELSQPPRNIEIDWTIIRMGVSVFTSRDSARSLARTLPKLGDYIAKLVLKPGMGINYGYTTRTPHHLTIGPTRSSS
jgi:hypothetical protein